MLVDVLHQLFELFAHFLHLLAHAQDHLDSGEVDSQVAREVQDDLQAPQILVRVEPGVALAARRFQETQALIESERLRVDAIRFSHRAYHVAGLFPWSHRALRLAAAPEARYRGPGSATTRRELSRAINALLTAGTKRVDSWRTRS